MLSDTCGNLLPVESSCGDEVEPMEVDTAGHGLAWVDRIQFGSALAHHSTDLGEVLLNHA
jgi:hypothetical protein